MQQYRLARSATVSDRGRGRHDQSRTCGDHGDLRRLSGCRVLGLRRIDDRNFPALVSSRARSRRRLLARHRGNPNVQGFVKGAYAAAIGTILGACILLGTNRDRRLADGAAIATGRLAVLFRWKVSNPLLIAATAAVRSDRLPDPAADVGDGSLAEAERKWSDSNRSAEEITMTRRKMLLMTASATAVGLVTLVTLADQNAVFANDDEGQKALIKLMDAAKIDLQQGLTASEQGGAPISAKFEVDKGTLQAFSVYRQAGKVLRGACQLCLRSGS